MRLGDAAPHRDTIFDMLGKRKAKLANQIKNKSKETISQGQLKVYETTVFFFLKEKTRTSESRQGRMADALALTGDEGRDKLR